MRLFTLTFCAAALFAGGALAADHPPVGVVVVAKDNNKSYRHTGNGQFVEVAASLPACTTCGPSCPCPAGVCADGKCPVSAPAAGNDALSAVNAKRAARGLPPYQFDPALAAAAQACASHRAQRGIFGHVNDFAFLPQGARAEASGCAAYPAHMGFLACAVYDNYRYAGAASVLGADGRTYHHLFVSNSPSGANAGYIQPNPPAVPQGVYTLPAAGSSCPNGQCGIPQSQPRGFFRR